MSSNLILSRTLQRVLLAAGFALLLLGLCTSEVLAELNPARGREALWYAAYALAIAAVLARILRLDLARTLVGFLLILQLAMVGIAASLAVAVLALTAIAVGSLLVPADARPRSGLALILGLGCIAGAVGWLLPYAVHRMPVYAAACAVLIVARRRALGAALKELSDWWRSPQRLGVEGVVAVLVIGYVATSAWLPTAQYDDLGYHIGMSWQLATLAHYRFDVVSQEWALAPWSSDVLQAIPMVLARVEARGALDTLWLLAILQLSWSLLGRLQVPLAWRWLALALFASQPLVHTLLGSMQTELAGTAALLALALMVFDSDTPERARARLPAFGALIGFALGIKLTGLFLAFPLALWFLLRARPARPSLLLRPFLLSLLAGGSSYVYAAILTGNPIPPFYNDVFHSPLLAPIRHLDLRYIGHLTWSAPYDLVFHTHLFQEARDGGGGFQWIALLGLLLPGLVRERTRALTLVALVAIVSLYLQVQYLRYLLPALAVLGVALIGTASAANAGFPTRAAMWLLVGLNVAALGNSMWLYREGTFHHIASAKGSFEADYLRNFAPERLLARYLRERYGENLGVLLLGEFIPFGAELAGHAQDDSSYDPELNQRAQQAREDVSGAAYAALFRDTGSTHVIVHPMDLNPALSAALAAHATLELRVGIAELYRIKPAVTALEGLPSPADAWQSAPLLLHASTAISGPLAVDYQVVVACRPLEGVVAARLRAVVGSATPQRQLDYQKCPPSGTMRLEGFGRMRQTDGVQILLEPGGSGVPTEFAVQDAQVTIRPDLSVARDLSARLRL